MFVAAADGGVDTVTSASRLACDETNDLVVMGRIADVGLAPDAMRASIPPSGAPAST